MSEARDDLEFLKNRLLKLERQNRVLVCTGVLTLGGLFLAGLLGLSPTPDRVLVAEKFILRDKTGVTRAILDTGGNAPSFLLYDNKNRSRVALSVGPDGTPLLALADEKGKARINLSLAAGRAPYLEFYSTEADPKVALSLSQDGESRFFLFDQKQKKYWSAP